METLIKRIFEVTGVTYEEMCSSVKNPSFNYARILFCHEMRFKHGLTCKEIGLKGFTVKEKSNEFNTNFKTPKIKHRSEKGKEIVKAELLLFQKIFKERPPFCEWCKASITVFSPMNYHHLRPKGSHPELRLVESNIVKICAECHLKEHGFKPRVSL